MIDITKGMGGGGSPSPPRHAAMSSIPPPLLLLATVIIVASFPAACGFSATPAHSSIARMNPPLSAIAPPSITRRDAIERFRRLRIVPFVVSVVDVAATTAAMPPYANAAADDAVVDVGGSTSSAAASSVSTTPIYASWTAVDGLNTLDEKGSGEAGGGKFVSFDESAYMAMINDKSRTPQFERAIINRLNDKNAIGDGDGGPSSMVVLDIGTGPYAYFALIAAKAGAGKVYAIEASRSACESARIAVSKAGYDDVITIIEGYSTEVTLPDNIKADFVIAEIVGSVSSEEGAYATMSDARRRLVRRPNDASSYIPRGIQTYASPASYTLHNLFLPPAFDWTKLNGSPVRFNCRDEGLQLLSDPVVVEEILFADMDNVGGGGGGGAEEVGSKRRGGGVVRKRMNFVVDPIRVEENAKKFNDEYVRGRVPDATTLSISAANSVSGIALWPRLILDDDIIIDSRNHPDGGHRRSHWQTVLPIMSPVPVTLHGGDEVIVDFDFYLPYDVTYPPTYKIAGNVISKRGIV